MKLSQLSVAIGLLVLSQVASAATIVIVNVDGAGEGFNDPTPVAPVGANPGVTLGQQRLNVFQAAANQWGAVLTSAVAIRVNAKFDPQTCDANGAVLGSAGANNWVRSFTNTPPVPYNETWFSVAEANALAGSDQDAAGDDIVMTFNVSIDAGCLPGTVGWWYDTGGVLAIPNDRIALMPVVFHEIAHGLGFQTLTNTATGRFAPTSGNPNNRRPDIWAHFLMDRDLGANGTTWVGMGGATGGNTGETERTASAIDDPFLIWSGANVTGTAGGYLDPNPALVVGSPPAIAGTYPAQPASFGPLVPLSGLSGLVAEALDGTAPATDGCEAIVNPGQVNSRIALVDRGTCNFTVKVANAEAAGAIAVLVANNVATGLPGMGGSDPTIGIPSYGISQALGAAIRANLGAGVNATLGFDFGSLAGMQGGFLRMYAPNPREPGSSVSHFSTAASPNLLMEPALNQELFNETDLTVPLFRDIFWPINNAAIANKAPTINAAAVFVATVNTPTPLSEILFGDVDAGTNAISLRFQVGSGTITLLPAAGVTPSGSGSSDATISGARSTLLPYVAGGNVRFTTALDDLTDVALTLTINDNGNTGTGGALTATDTATIDVVPNNPPVANDDAHAINEDSGSATVNVLGNDTDAENNTLTVTAVGTATRGVAALSLGVVSYTPNLNANGADAFTYTISDGNGGSDTATVNVTITAINDAPDAVNDAHAINEDSGSATVDVLANDTDVENDTLSVTAVGAATQGIAALNAGVVSYTPNLNANGADAFTYTISDGAGGSDTATVNVTITAVNDAPDAVNDAHAINEDSGSATVDVLANDTDVENDTLSVTAVGTATQGVAALNAGVVSYTPNLNANGADAFTYTISDGAGGSDTATVNVTITAQNDAPTAVGTIANRTDVEGAVVTQATAANFNDVDNDTLAYSATGLPTGLSIDSGTGVISGTLDLSASAGSPFSVVVTATDPSSAPATQDFIWTVTDLPPNQAPTFINEPYAFMVNSTAAAGAAVGTIAATDADVAQTLSYSITGGNSGAAFAIDTNTGAITVATPAALGPIDTVFTLSVSVSDGNGGSDTSSVTIRVVSADGRIFYNGFEGN